MSGFPPAYCRVVACAVDGDDAYVVLDAGPAQYAYLYRVAAWWRVLTSAPTPVLLGFRVGAAWVPAGPLA